jgi:tetratricopeptide (TPR) repeat protein
MALRSMLVVLLIALTPAGVCARAQAEGASPQRTLGQELEGLAPGPRIAYLMHLLKSRPADSEVLFQLGVAYQEDSKPDSAVLYYEKATAVEPTLSKAYVNMGVLLDEQHKPGEAIAMFEKAASINPNDVLAHAHAAYMLLEQRDYEPAWSHLAKALAIDSLNPQPHFYLAIFFWESGMYREALAEWETVVRLAPGSYLARKAEENIAIIQQALTASSNRAVEIQR